ncbi:uncharacterized protein EDB91DRAFT_1237277 [Suillus paluster]|uniref:uncharacterized protein n=1 Tax=Suillus paluster TaxID=48578 RepID=UPI001B869C49|nr:uncharacterized protein EDB91DRAFT_1237277 [Suillus paluster]KAG1740437.1 hypothetical protein EDB91DRAFT_1237277 [Suillus paluster]
MQKWNGNYFEQISLKTMGLRIQLGHPTGQRCLTPCRAFNDDFIIVNSHGIHEVSLDFCDCTTAESHFQQLLRISWFPSTTSDPKTAATFRVLEQYHLLLFKFKVSAYEFYHSLRQMSNNTGLLPIKDRYESFMRMVREWHHLKMLKCSGRGHDPSGVDGMAESECTILCPACPHPGKNLPADWKESPRQWLYALFLTIDANFRLKRKALSNDNVDPSLSRGWGYFVEEEAYKYFLHNSAGCVQEKSTCSSHNAVNMADTKCNHRLATTGLGTVDCTHHNMKRPNAVGDLQKGEKYINMDYLFFSTLRHTVLDTLNVSYDIVCQWHKNLWHHMSAFPLSMQLSQAIKTVSFFCAEVPPTRPHRAVPNIVLFNFKSGVGRTDGEAPEHGWVNINPITSSTKEMGPGAQQDTLDDYFGDSNWKKIVGLALTMASVRLELAREDQVDLQMGTCLALDKDCTPSVLISTGLELEEQHNTLRWRIDTWAKMQELYMPFLTALRASESSILNNVAVAPEAIKLWLPSQISRTVACDARLQDIEWKLWYAQAHDALRSLCSNLCAQSAILKYKDRNLRGQGANTRAWNTLKAVEARIKAAASTYEHAHKSLTYYGENQRERKKLLWIWSMQGVAPNEMDKDNTLEDMQIEWCKARAWVMCWAEEVELIQQFFEWDAQRWDKRGLGNALQDIDECKGQMAYTKCQAVLRQILAESFKTSWADTLAFVDSFEDMDLDTSST